MSSAEYRLLFLFQFRSQFSFESLADALLVLVVGIKYFYFLKCSTLLFIEKRADLVKAYKAR